MAVKKIRFRENVNKPTINVDYDSISGGVMEVFRKVRDELRKKGYEIPEGMSTEFLSVKPRDVDEAFDVLSKYVDIRFNGMKNESLRENINSDINIFELQKILNLFSSGNGFCQVEIYTLETDIEGGYEDLFVGKASDIPMDYLGNRQVLSLNLMKNHPRTNLVSLEVQV